MIINHERVKLFLPHRDPFLFVDHILSIEIPEEAKKLKVSERKKEDLLSGKVHGVAKISSGHPIFLGHFPGNPILPGVIQIEMMAQVACFLFSSLREDELGSYKLDVALLGIEKARFRNAVGADCILDIKTTFVKSRNWLLKFCGEVYHEHEKCSECEFMAKLSFINN